VVSSSSSSDQLSAAGIVNLFHDGAENLIELQRRRQRFPNPGKWRPRPFALLERHRGSAAAIDGRERLTSSTLV